MPKVVIAGCGFVGLATARLLHDRSWDVVGATHSQESAAQLAGEPFPVVACDISDRFGLAQCDSFKGAAAVVHCASSGRAGADAYQRVYLEGARNLADILPGATLLFTSSTSVYPQTDGSWVSEESPAMPDRDTGRILKAAEQLVLERGGVVTRLAGIYGPRRSVLLKKFFAGDAVIEGDGERWINQVHRDDIATALVMLLEKNAKGCFNLSDDEPLQQRALYQWLAHRFGHALPPSVPIDLNRKRGWTNKRVSNKKMRALGWAPRFSSFQQAVEEDADLVSAARV